MQDSLLKVRNLSVDYKTDEAVFYAVNDISFELAEGETIGIVGETGAGKTTTALAIMRLLPARTGRITSGEILFDGADLLKKPENEMRLVRGALISMIFQDPMTSLNPIMTVGRQIYESLEIHNQEHKSKQELEARVDELLELVGIPSRRKAEYPHQFSGGMKQRVVIAIALACEPKLLIADEPTTALDVTIQAQVLEMMHELKKQFGTAMIMITHDLGVVAETCDSVAIMYAGELIETGRVADIFEGDRHHPYTTGLFESIPDLETSTDRLQPIEGLMPDPAALPAGCRFHPRCKQCMEICKTVHPKPAAVNSHVIACHLFAEGGAACES